MSKILVSAFSKHNFPFFFELDSKRTSAEGIPALIILVIRALAQDAEETQTPSLSDSEREFGNVLSSKETFPTEQSSIASLVILSLCWTCSILKSNCNKQISTGKERDSTGWESREEKPELNSFFQVVRQEGVGPQRTF